MSVSFSTIIQRARPQSSHIASQTFRDVLAKIPTTNVVAISNGVRVAAEENPNAKFATVGVSIEMGTRNDPTECAGITRVLEKCGFMGTVNMSRDQIAKSIDEIGGQLSIKIDRESTFLSMKVAKANVNRAVSILADVTRNARFADEDIAAAKKIVEVQRNEFEDRPDDVVEDNLFRAAFDSTDVGLGAPLYGVEDQIKKLTREQLLQHRATHIVGSRITVVGSGGVNHTELEKAATQYLGDLPRGDTNKPTSTRYVGGECRLWNLRFKVCHSMFAVETCGAVCEDSIPLQLVAQITGNYHRSQHELGQAALHRQLKMFSSHDFSGPTDTHLPEKAIEVANSFVKQYSDSGLMGMYLVTRPCQVAPGDATSIWEVLQVSMNEWCRLSQKILHPTEADQAKVNLKAQLLFNMDGSQNSAEDIARQVRLYGRRVPLEEMYARIDDITPNNMQETLYHYFFAKRPVYSHLGYTYAIPMYDYSQNWTYKYFL
jgi:predicted Zn-dependent peptidase